MKAIRLAAPFVMLSLSLATPVAAQTADDEQAQVQGLGQCLSMKSTGEDRIAFAAWLVVGMSSAPQLKGLASVAPADRDGRNRDVARIFTRLIVKDCIEYAKPLLKAGKTKAFSAAFETFGRMAMEELMSNPGTDKAMSEFTKYLSDADFADLKK